MKPKISTVAAAMLFAAMTAAHADVVISTKPTQNMNCTGGVCTPTAQKAVLNVGDLANMLAGGDVKVSSGSLAQDIEIDAALSWTSTSRLTLDSYRAISFNKPVVVAGTGALTITTNDGGTGGDFRFFGKGHVEFWDLDGKLVINGQSYNLVKGIHDLNRNGGGYAALANSFSAKSKVYSEAPIKSVGTLEGLGNQISNLTIVDGTHGDLVALIGRTGYGSVIRDIGLVSVDIQGLGLEQLVASLVGQNSGLIANSYATGSVTISGQNSQGGGLVGDNQNGVISRSSGEVAVSATKGVVVVGGLVGDNIGECIGACTGVIDESFCTSAVTGGDGAWIGGLAGLNIGGTISNSYATGTVQGGSSAVVGGLIGANGDGNTFPRLQGAYSIGAVIGETGAIFGGLIGQDVADAQNASAYWDLDTSGISDPAQGAGNIANDPGITGLTTVQFKSGLPGGFDKKVWKESASINNGYPYLLANPPPQ